MSTTTPTALAEQPRIGRLTIFTFLWACQALIHQEFYLLWLPEGDVFGWILTGFAAATLVCPRSLPLFCAMLASSVVYNVNKWPFVVNHILVESVINLTILAAVGWTLLRRQYTTRAERDDMIFDRFAPVVIAMVVVMYYFAFVAKLNRDFFDVEISCVSMMYGDLVNRFTFLPNNEAARIFSIWATLVVEALIPVFLTFRRTRPLAILIGVPFHFILGLVGHRTFSGLAYAVYGLFLIDPLTAWVNATSLRLRERFAASTLRNLSNVLRVGAVLTIGVLIGSHMTGNYQTGIGPLKFFRVPWLIWICWSILIGTVYTATIIRFRKTTPHIAMARPALLWVVITVVFLNGFSQYIGLKTETCFTMYSNLRTEGDVNNHLFMPALRLADYQDDLVQITETNDPKLQKYIEKEQYQTWFELRRTITNAIAEDRTLYVRYIRDGEEHTFHTKYDPDVELTKPHPTWLAKLLYFRPVDMSDRMCCQH